MGDDLDARDLTARDDAALTALAFGRPTDEVGRRRAQAAAAILQDRAESAHHPDAHDPHANQSSHDSQDAPHSNDAAAAPDDEPRRTPGQRRRRALLAGAIGASLLTGALGGVLADRWASESGTDSLTVFDRPGTPQELSLPASVFGPDVDGDARLLHEDGEQRVYGMRITGPSGFFGVGDTGPQICVLASVSGQIQYPEVCVPELVFREQGLTGFLPFIDRGIYPSLLGGVGVSWGPRGGLEVRDLSESLLGSALYSDDELAQGLDIPAIRALEIGRPITTTELPLETVEYGPVQVGAVGSVGLLGATRVASPTASGAAGSDRSADTQRIVCLTPVYAGEVLASYCASMGQFRAEGLRGSFEFGASLYSVEWSPQRGILVDRTQE